MSQDLLDQIDFKSLECLNANPSHNADNALKKVQNESWINNVAALLALLPLQEEIAWHEAKSEGGQNIAEDIDLSYRTD